MILGVANGESYIGSDVPAILKYTRDVYYIGNQEMARVRKGEITFYNLDGEEIEKELKTVEWDAEAAEKSGYEHFMIKEIHEQPKAVSDTLNSVIKDGMIDLSEVGLSEEEIKEISQIYIVACGSAYHVGVAAQYVMEDLARIPVRVELASEFRYRNPILDPKGLVVIISQSGETADSLAALRESKKQGRQDRGERGEPVERSVCREEQDQHRRGDHDVEARLEPVHEHDPRKLTGHRGGRRVDRVAKRVDVVRPGQLVDQVDLREVRKRDDAEQHRDGEQPEHGEHP